MGGESEVNVGLELYYISYPNLDPSRPLTGPCWEKDKIKNYRAN
jgi:hypothetical protein